MQNILMDYLRFTKQLLINWPISFGAHFTLGGGLSRTGASLMFWGIINVHLNHMVIPFHTREGFKPMKQSRYPLWYGLNTYGRCIYTASMLTLWGPPVALLLWLIS